MKTDRFKKMLILQLIFLLITIALYILINTSLYKNNVNCTFLKITGFLCPACGGTRCVNSILRLDFINALKYNAAIFVTCLYIFVINLAYIIGTFFNKKIVLFKTYHVYIWLVAFFIYAILRNIY